MTSSTMLKIQMQGLGAKHQRFHVAEVVGVAALSRFAVAEPRRKTHTDFYRNESMKDFEEVRKADIFQSAK